MYLHCPRCQASVTGAQLMSSNMVCPRCGEPATGPLSFFSSLPRRYRKPPRKTPFVARERHGTPGIIHR